MNNLDRDTTIRFGNLFLDGKWYLNTYLIKSNADETIEEETVRKLIEKHLHLLESNCMSDEFDYYKTGFAFLHFGNRGVDLTIWHIGRWGSTFETFICSWYCYERDFWNMGQLDSAEPMLCQYEMKSLLKEINNIAKLVEFSDIDVIRKHYLELSLS